MNIRILGMMLATMTLAACGGGGSGAAAPSGNSQPASVAPPASQPSNLPPSGNSSAADLALADRLYKGDARTPAGFDVESRPANVAGMVSTRHLKNTDFVTGPQAITPVYEVCTNDLAQALDWSERQATFQGQYSDLSEVNSDAHMFEIVRVPRSDATAVIRHRVFRCDYLDRTGSDLRADAGAAGSMNQRPLTGPELEKLAEYLWQFTTFNNSEYAVESSSASNASGALVETIRMGRLVPSASGCDNVQVLDWTHTMDATTGVLTRTLTIVRTFKAKNSSGSTQLCSA
jgi:hypothetical protein